MASKKDYDADYYEANSQNTDRLANHFFSNILKKYLEEGTLLEYGCGSGFFIQKFSDDKYKKMATDISDYAMEMTAINNPGIVTFKNPFKQIKANSLDGIAALHVLEHIETPQEVVKEFHKILKKHGVLFFTVPNMSSWGRALKRDLWFGYRDKTHISLLHPHEWITIVEQSGFEVLKVGSDGLWDVPYVKYVPLPLQKLIFYPTSAIQVWTKYLFMPIATGENLVVIARKK